MGKPYPATVAKLVTYCDAWIVGSGAKPIPDVPRDWDVAVPFFEWNRAAAMIPADAKPNSFGGWKFEEGGCVVDVWPDDIGKIMTNAMTTHVWHPKSGVRFARAA